MLSDGGVLTVIGSLYASYQLLKSLVPMKPYPTLEGFQTVFAELAEKVPAKRTANPKDFVDARFLEEFDRSGFITKRF